MSQRTRIRPPAVDGRFYPADRAQLTALVDRLLDAVAVPEGEAPATAYVVPHAGYPYSGPTAAHAYARLRRRVDGARRVVLVGPAHYVPLSGCAAPAADGWRTPLGEVTIDADGARELARGGRLVVDDGPHGPEHSLEVQLPFLQRVLAGSVPVLPIVVGPSSITDVAATLAAAAAPPGTVVLCSTDLSHYLDQRAAEQRDARTVGAVLDLAPERLGARDACGVYALRGLLAWARDAGQQANLLHRCTSADTAGDPTRVVGYAAVSFTPAT